MPEEKSGSKSIMFGSENPITISIVKEGDETDILVVAIIDGKVCGGRLPLTEFNTRLGI